MHDFYIFDLFYDGHQDYVVVSEKKIRFVVSASRTSDGAPVYLTANRTWAREVGAACAVADGPEREDLLAWARGQEAEVCDPYAFKVSLEQGKPVPLTARERIRSQGPTVPVPGAGDRPRFRVGA